MRHRRRLAWVVVGAAVSVACTAPSQGSDTPVAQPVAAAAAASVASAPAGPVGSFMLALAAPAVLIERTKSAAVAVSVTRVAPFNGPVTVSVGGAGASAALPTGVLANALTIPAGRSVGTLTIAVLGAAKFGSSALTVRGAAPGGVATTSVSLALVVGRATGGFAEASPTPYASTVPSNVTSHTAAYRVEVAAAAAGAAQARTARYFKGPIPLGSELGFSLGPAPALGGAGFCDDLAAGALARGVVLSATAPGSRTQNVVTFVDLTGNAAVVREVGVDMHAVAPKPRVFAPRVFFSPDCSIALVAGVNRRASPHHLLQLVDLTTGNRLGSDIGFSSTQFQAQVKSAGTAQQLEVTVDAGSATARTISIALP